MMGMTLTADLIWYIGECTSILLIYRFLLNGSIKVTKIRAAIAVVLTIALGVIKYVLLKDETLVIINVAIRLLMCYIFCDNKKNKAWGIIISFIFVNIIDSLPGIIYRVNNSGSSYIDVVNAPIRSIIITIAHVAIFWLMFYLINRRYKNNTYVLNLLALRYKITILAILILCILTVGGTQLFILEDVPEYFKTVLAIGIMCVCIIMVAFCICQIILYNSRNHYKELSDSKARIIQLNSRYYELQKEYYDTARHKQHDYLKHLRCINQLGLNEQYDEQRRYIDELIDNTIIEKGYIDCHNSILSAVITDAHNRAKSAGIRLVCNGHVDNMNRIEDTDMCSLISNILDNAIEAAQGEITEPYIDITLGYIDERMCIKVSNSTTTESITNNTTLISDKGDLKLHGIGMNNIKEIVEKYNGTVDWGAKNNIFTITVVI